MANEFVARKGLISLSTSSFYGPVNFSGSSLVGIGTGSVLFTNAIGSVTGSSNLFWDNTNARLGVGTNAPNSPLHINNTITASGAIARGANFTQTINASANNDVLTGLDISPTINKGAFTGVVSSGLRINGNNISERDSPNNHKVLITATSNGTSRIYLDSNATGAGWNTGFSLSATNISKWSIAGYGLTYDFTIYNDSVSAAALFIKGSTNNISIGTTTDSGYRLDINGTGAASGSLRVSGSTTASGGTATSVSLIPTLVAAANNDTLVGLDVSPTFTNGAYTGVANYAIRATGQILIRRGGGNATEGFSMQYVADNTLGGTYQSKFNSLDPGVAYRDLVFTSRATLFQIDGYRNSLLISNNGNVVLNSLTDGGYRLDVNGTGAASGSLRVTGGAIALSNDVTIIGSGATGATKAINILNSSALNIMYLHNNGNFYVYGQTTTSGIISTSQFAQLAIQGGANSTGTAVSITGIGASNLISSLNLVSITRTYDPTSGSGVYNNLVINPTINQTGGANGITRGLYVNPTLTAAADFRAIEWSNNASGSTSWGLYGAGTAPNYLGGNLLVGTTADSGYRLHISGSTSGSILVSGSTTQPTVVGNSLTSVNIIPTMVFTTASQTQTAFKVMPTFSGSSAFTSSQSNIIADFGATSVGSQLIVTDVTSGSIYMVNDVSGIPIIEANSNWDVFMYDYPYTVFKKTGSAIELGVAGQASSSVTLKSDLVINEGLGFTYRQTQVSGSTDGAVTSSLYNIQFTNTSASVYINAIVTGYDTGSRDTIAGDIKATIRYRGGVASIVGIDQTFINTDNSVVGFDIVAGGTSGSLVAFGTGSRVYQWGATITTQVI